MLKLKKAKATVLRHTALPVLLVWLAVWYAVSELIGLELLIPSPSAVFDSFITLIKEKEFYISCLNSLYKVIAGWSAGIISGTLIAVLTGISPVLREFFKPVLHIIKATPVASFIILALVLMSSGKVPIFTCALITVPVVWANISEGILSPDKKILEMADFFGMPVRKRITDIYIPAILPYFSAAATTTMGLSWKAGIAAEVICTPADTIGAGIQNAKIYLETPSLFAWTLTVIVLSMLLEKLLTFILKKHGGKV